MVGTSLTAITSSLSQDILMPLIVSSWSGSNIEVSRSLFLAHATLSLICVIIILPVFVSVHRENNQESFVVLREGSLKCKTCYETVLQAQDDGAVSLQGLYDIRPRH